MRKKRTFLPETYVVLMLLLMYLPIFVVVAYSFNDTKLFHWAGFTFSWYQKLFHNQTIINAFFNGPLIQFFRTHVTEPLLHGRPQEQITFDIMQEKKKK